MFNNPFSMVVAIVAIVAIASIVRARYGLRRDFRRDHGRDNLTASDRASDHQRLTEEIALLKDRVAALELHMATRGMDSSVERETARSQG